MELPVLSERLVMGQPEGLSSCLSRSPSSKAPKQTVTKREVRVRQTMWARDPDSDTASIEDPDNQSFFSGK